MAAALKCRLDPMANLSPIGCDPFSPVREPQHASTRSADHDSSSLPVSAVIPAYNRADLVVRAIRSAFAQRPTPPAEVIVIDDCSSDDTGALAAAAGARVVRHDVNRGEGGARNTGLREATHDWVALLDSDDEWLPTHLRSLWPHREGRVVMGSTALARGDDPAADRLWGRDRETLLELRSPADVLDGGNALVASSVMLRRDIALEVGGFREAMPRGADLDLWLRMLEHGPGIVSPTVTVRYHLHAGQVSDDRRSMWDAHRSIVDAYRDRPWCTSRVRRRASAVLEWDQLRDDLRSRDVRGAAAAATSIARDPVKSLSVGRLLLARHRLRRRTTRVTRAMEAAVAP
jgi:glycosyltransferase involved in cell wall biosynthesis